MCITTFSSLAGVVVSSCVEVRAGNVRNLGDEDDGHDDAVDGNDFTEDDTAPH